MGLIINCDLGENEDEAKTAALLKQIDAANICCGVHAGSLEKTRATLRLAHDLGVKIGAHPGVRAEGGRGALELGPGDFRELLDAQVGCFLEEAQELGAEVFHVKLHGALYHAVESDLELRAVLIEWLQEHPRLVLFSFAGGDCLRAVEAAGLPVLGEVFADRGYLPIGKLVPRGEPGALIEETQIAVERLQRWAESGLMACVDGSHIQLEGKTVCVHSDSPSSLELLEQLKAGMS